jgi:hypothetical protein
MRGVRLCLLFGQLTEKEAIKKSRKINTWKTKLLFYCYFLTVITGLDILSIHVNVWTKSP